MHDVDKAIAYSTVDHDVLSVAVHERRRDLRGV